MPTIRVEVATVIRAFKPGDIIFIECERSLSQQQRQDISEALSKVAPDMKIVVLDAGMRVVGREERHDITTTDAKIEDPARVDPGRGW